MYENRKLFTVKDISPQQRRAAFKAADIFGFSAIDIEKSTSRGAAKMAMIMCLTLRYFTDDGLTHRSISKALGKSETYCRDICKAGKKLLKENAEFADKLRDYAIIYNNEYKRIISQNEKRV